MGKIEEGFSKELSVNEDHRNVKTVKFQKCQWHSLNFVILCFFIVSFNTAATTSVHLYKSESSIHHSSVGSLQQHHRVLRSPYLPPTVIGRQPSKRANESDTLNVIIRSSVDNLRSPIVHSQSTSGLSAEGQNDSQIDETDSFDYKKVMTTYAFPRPPMVVDSSALDSPTKTRMLVNDEEEELLIRLQNDQSFVNESEGEKDQGGADNSKRYGKSQKSKDKNSKRLMKFVDFSQVLNTINMTNGQLEALLKRKNIAFNDFLEFIENGASEEQILKLLESPKHPPTLVPDTKPNWKSKAPSKKFQSTDDGNTKMIFKGLTELPFTEIVHQVPFEDGKQFDINHQSNVKKSPVDSKNKSKLNGKKWSRSPKTKQLSDKENYINQPWDYEAEFDYYLPPKDSPIVTHFQPSRSKNKTQISASILSLSVNKQQENPNRENAPSEHHHFHVRNKVASTETIKVESSSLPRVSSADMKTTKESEHPGSQYKDSQYVRQQLRLVFPMRGIVIFCGILGIIAFFTILILVIYGTLKCNDKPVNTPKTYKVNEQNEIAVTAT